jgi:hypothetical protein
MTAKEALDETRRCLALGPSRWNELDLALHFDTVLALVDLIDRAEVAARETVMALDGVEQTWDHMAQPPSYGRGLSRWDGPSLLKRWLADYNV